MTKFTIVAAIAVFALGAVVGRATVPTLVPGSAAALTTISPDEITRKAGPLPVEYADAI
jgi:hypothetical protein